LFSSYGKSPYNSGSHLRVILSPEAIWQWHFLLLQLGWVVKGLLKLVGGDQEYC
jgi:hypothetical protein